MHSQTAVVVDAATEVVVGATLVVVGATEVVEAAAEVVEGAGAAPHSQRNKLLGAQGPKAIVSYLCARHAAPPQFAAAPPTQVPNPAQTSHLFPVVQPAVVVDATLVVVGEAPQGALLH